MCQHCMKDYGHGRLECPEHPTQAIATNVTWEDMCTALTDLVRECPEYQIRADGALTWGASGEHDPLCQSVMQASRSLTLVRRGGPLLCGLGLERMNLSRIERFRDKAGASFAVLRTTVTVDDYDGFFPGQHLALDLDRENARQVVAYAIAFDFEDYSRLP